MKYNLGQTIFYLMYNAPCSATVLARMQVENLHEDWTNTKEQKALFTPFGPSGVSYKTCHGIIKEESAFASKEDLAASLI